MHVSRRSGWCPRVVVLDYLLSYERRACEASSNMKPEDHVVGYVESTFVLSLQVIRFCLFVGEVASHAGLYLDLTIFRCINFYIRKKLE